MTNIELPCSNYALLAQFLLTSLRPFFWFGLIVIASFAVIQAQSVPSVALAALEDKTTEITKLQLSQSGAGDIPMPPNTPSAHASSLVPLSSAHSESLAVAWFAGERESAPDVRIAFSSFDREAQEWQPARHIASRESIGQSVGFGIRRLGNPVLWRDPVDRLHLFVVGTGLGGWAASRIIHLRQSGNAKALDSAEFTVRQVLPLSWFWNTSHLVRNAPLNLADGGAALPVYFEIGAKYPLIATISPQGEFAGVTRISSRRKLLQPALVAVDSQHWLAYMRMSGGSQRIAVAETRNGGQHWHDLPDLDLPNPNAAVAAIGLGKVQALAFNPSITTRDALSLALSKDGRNWTTAADIEKGAAGDEFSYPAMAWADNALWVSYTNRREKISWKRYVFAEESQ